MRITSLTRRRLSAAVAAGLLSAALWAQSLAASAHEALASGDSELSAQDPGDVLLTAGEASSQDSARMAQENGMTESEARDRFEWQARIHRLIQAVVDRGFLDVYAGGETRFEPYFGAVLHFVGPVPNEINDIKRDHGFSDEVELIGQAPFNLEDRDSIQLMLHTSLLEAGASDVTTAFDVSSQTIAVDLARADGPGTAREQAARKRELVATFNGGRGRLPAIDGTLVRYSEHTAGTQFVVPTHSYGGQQVYATSTGAWCTNAFTVRRNSDFVEGTTTAAHCEGINRMRQYNTSGSSVTTFSAPFGREHVGVYGDVEFHTTSHTDYPRFFSATTTLRSTTGKKQAYQMNTNDQVCRYGRRTGGPHCSNIVTVSRTVSFTWLNGQQYTAAGMVEMSGTSDNGGDSGGPWFTSGTAWGIHHGHLNSNHHEIFSKITNAETALGVTLRTESPCGGCS